MRGFLVLIVSVLFSITAFAQQDSGFTNKAEAKNLMVDGKKEGRWVEYTNNMDIVTSDYWFTVSDTNAPYYILTIYKAGERTGIVRQYFKSGKIAEETFFKDPVSYGIVRTYYENGQLQWEEPSPDSNGIAKMYYENGSIEKEEPVCNGKENGIEKHYFENGVLLEEAKYSNGLAEGTTKAYLENGKLFWKCTYTKDLENEWKNIIMKMGK